MKKYLLTLITLLLLSPTSWALSLNDAKAQGLIGERTNGYLGIVTTNADSTLRVLVDDINRKRRKAYQEKAQKAGVDIQVIELRVGERLHKRASPGHFVQDNHGQWKRK